MTITSTASEISYAGNGVTTSFALPFPFDTAADLKVSSTDSSGNITELTTGWSTTGGGGSTGNILFTTAPASGVTIAVTDDPDITQPTDYQNNDAFPAESTENALDRVTRIAKRLAQRLTRTIHTNDGDPITDMTLGSVANRKGKYLFFNAVTGAIEYALLTTTTISQSIIGQLLNPQTPAEAYAGIIPTNYWYPAYNVLRYGADPTGVLDSTVAFNSATAAAAAHTGNDTVLKREITIPGGTFKLCSQSTTQSVYVRKGQHFRGAGMGATYLDFSSGTSNTAAHIVMATNSSAVDDAGGLAPEISGCFMWGGSATAPVIDAQRAAGYAIHDCFFSNSGIGIKTGGSDGLVYDCIFDQGLTGIQLGGQNVTVDNCEFFLLNYQMIVLTGAHDCNINNCHFVYPQYSSILLNTAATDIKNLSIRNSTFVMNVQYGTFLDFISVASVGADLFVTGCTFRNAKGAALAYGAGSGNVVVMSDCVIDGDRTTTAYTQGVSSSGVIASDMDVTLRNVTFRNLRAQPVTLGGTLQARLFMQSCSFQNCTGGTTDILISNNNGNSSVVLYSIEGSGRLLYTAQGTVLVYAKDVRNWLAAQGNASARDFVLVPFQFSNLYSIAMRANMNSGGGAQYRKSTLIFAEKDNDFSGTAKSFVKQTTALAGDANFNGALDVTVEFTSVGGGTNIANANQGLLCISWPQAYSIEYVDVQPLN